MDGSRGKNISANGRERGGKKKAKIKKDWRGRRRKTVRTSPVNQKGDGCQNAWAPKKKGTGEKKGLKRKRRRGERVCPSEGGVKQLVIKTKSKKPVNFGNEQRKEGKRGKKTKWGTKRAPFPDPPGEKKKKTDANSKAFLQPLGKKGPPNKGAPEQKRSTGWYEKNWGRSERA